jgi:phage virion morphogenesis protein
MSGEISISVEQLDDLIARLRRAHHVDTRKLMGAIGSQQENAARKRVSQTKRAPDGTRWRDWSDSYRPTRSKQHSLLSDSGNLLDAMMYRVEDPETVRVGSAMDYAAHHLYGTRLMPARPFLDNAGGFADSRDRAELGDIVSDFLEHLFV